MRLPLGGLLIAACFFDELASGIPFVGSPEIKSEFGVSYTEAAGVLLAAIGVLGYLLEPPLFLLADRWPRRWFVCGGLGSLGLVCIGAGLASSYALLVVALLLYGPLSGCGVALAQATLADANRDAPERALVRWSIAGALGDLSTPALIALGAWLAAGWRTAFVAAGVALLVQACVLWRAPFPEPRVRDDDAPEPSLARAFASALADRKLLVWAGAVALCGLMDEILVAFSSLYMRDVLDFPLETRSALLSVLIAGEIAGLVASERLLGVLSWRPLLLASGFGCAAAWAWFLSVSDVTAAALALFTTGVFAALHYPIAKAQAYRARPDGSGTVNAVLTLVGALELPVPILLGIVADEAGLWVALALLGVQPIGLALVALAAREPKALRA